MYTIFFDFSLVLKEGNKHGVSKTMYNLAKNMLQNDKVKVRLINVADALRSLKREEEKLLGLRDGDLGEDEILSIKMGDVLFLTDAIYTLGESDFLNDLIDMGFCVIPFIHDIIPVTHKKMTNCSTKFYDWIVNVTNFKTGIITNSLFTASTFLKKFRYDYPIGYIHLGCDKENFNFESCFLPSGKNVLMVSTIEPRKGYAETLDQFERIWQKRDDINVIIVGKKGWLVDELYERICSHPKKEKNLFVFSNISEAQLAYLYKEVDLFLFSSMVEGFGLGVIEAGRFGTPLLLRDIPVFREIAGEFATYFQTFENLSDKIIEGFDTGFKRSDGMKINSWKETADGCFKIIDGIRAKYLERF